MPSPGPDPSRHSGTARATGGSASSPAPGPVPQELDNLYLLVRGAPYANALGEAKKAYQGEDYATALKLLRDTAELHRRTHWHLLRQDAEKTDLGPHELKKLDKAKDVLERLDRLALRLEKLLKFQPEKSHTPDLPRPRLIARPKPPEPVSAESPAAEDAPPAESRKELPASLVDMGSFTQLQTAAQAAGLLPNADAVGFVRDHEFREGKYQEAFDRIEGLFIHLRTAAEQRAARLRQEELDFRSGKLKMSPKHWMIKQQRDAAQTQTIDRALRYFARVLDGLRIAMPPEE